MEHCSQRSIRIRTHIIDEHTHKRWQHSSLIQQIWPHTRIIAAYPLQHLSQSNGRGIERNFDTWLTSNDSRRTKECDRYLHGFALLKTHRVTGRGQAIARRGVINHAPTMDERAGKPLRP